MAGVKIQTSNQKPQTVFGSANIAKILDGKRVEINFLNLLFVQQRDVFLSISSIPLVTNLKLMKKSLTLVFIVCISFQTFAQSSGKIAISLQHKMKQVELSRSTGQEIALFLRGDVEQIKSLVAQLGGTFKYAAGDISAIRIPITKIQDLAASNAVTWIEDNNLKLKPMNDVAIITNKVNLTEALVWAQKATSSPFIGQENFQTRLRSFPDI